MGAAKKRGSFEDRKAQSIQAEQDRLKFEADYRAETERLVQEKIVAMSEGDRENYFHSLRVEKKRKSKLASIFAMASVFEMEQMSDRERNKI